MKKIGRDFLAKFFGRFSQAKSNLKNNRFFGKKKVLLVLFLIISLAFVGWFFQKRRLAFPEEKALFVQEGAVAFSVSSRARTVSELLSELSVSLGEKDRVFPALDKKLLSGMAVRIERATPISITVDGQTIALETFSRSAVAALGDAGVTLSHLDLVYPDKETVVEPGLEIEVVRVEVEEVTETQKIDFETIEKEDDDLSWRKKKVKQEGEKGQKEVTYRVTYKNGQVDEKEKIGSRVVKEPVDEIISIGTKIKVGKVQKGRASWYAYTGTMACASITFPKGTWLRVTNVDNGKQVIVVVNDYGPAATTNKVIDLDSVAFKKLAPLGQGVANVKIEEIVD